MHFERKKLRLLEGNRFLFEKLFVSDSLSRCLLRPNPERKREYMVREIPKKPRRVSDDEVRETILNLCREAGLDGAIRPEAVAQMILPNHWQTLLKRIRLMSKQLAVAGLLVILRKGEPADPHDFKGVVRLQITDLGLQELEERA
jgi:hypothetical protein